METKFLSIREKIILTSSLEKGDKKAITETMDEISRLEAVIKNYETGIKIITQKFNDKNFKNPRQ